VNLTAEIRKVLMQIPELGLVSIRHGTVEFTPPLFNLCMPLAGAVLSYLRTYSTVRGLSGDFFLCLYDGWREYSAQCASPVFVAWRDVDPSRYTGRGSAGEPRFMHVYEDGVFPVMPLPVLAFCRHHGDRNTFLLPDGEFLRNQFVGFTNQVAQSDKEWQAKSGTALYWRGSRLIVRRFNEPTPRDFVTSIVDPRIDARYSNRDVPISEFLNHKYLLDLDGMVSAWSGLYWKLRSNSMPVKLTSHWEQWYYPMLEDGKHLVLTDRDLVATYQRLIEDDDRSHMIAEQGRALSQMLTYAFAVEEFTIS
jgi:hypothetical protein